MEKSFDIPGYLASENRSQGNYRIFGGKMKIGQVESDVMCFGDIERYIYIKKFKNTSLYIYTY